MEKETRGTRPPAGAQQAEADLRKHEPSDRSRERHLEQRPAAADANFWAVFDSAPDAYLLLAPDPLRFTMVAANEARLRVTMTRSEDVVGRPLFEVLPYNPGDPSATGARNLRTSLDVALRTGKPHRMRP